MTDGDALLNAILRKPADDAPRLVYADFLDERGDGPRAEFIRVQVQRAAEGGDGLPPPGEGGPLAARERRLWRAYGWAWEHQFGGWLDPPRSRDPVPPPGRAWGCAFRRGFPAGVGLRPEAFLARGAAARLFASAPLTRVRLFGRDPRLDAGCFGWHLPWDRSPMTEDPSILPRELFDLLEGMLNPDDPAGDEFAYYETAEEAAPALSRAGVLFGRAEAGLSPVRRRVSSR